MDTDSMTTTCNADACDTSQTTRPQRHWPRSARVQKFLPPSKHALHQPCTGNCVCAPACTDHALHAHAQQLPRTLPTLHNGCCLIYMRTPRGSLVPKDPRLQSTPSRPPHHFVRPPEFSITAAARTFWFMHSSASSPCRFRFSHWTAERTRVQKSCRLSSPVGIVSKIRSRSMAHAFSIAFKSCEQRG